MINLCNIDIGFKTLLTIFKQFSTHESPPIIEVYPHSIDFSLGTIRFYGTISSTDIYSLIDVLNLKLPIKRVDCHGLIDPCFDCIVSLYHLLSINHSLIDVDIFPHYIDTESGIFSFSTLNHIELTVENVCDLSSFGLKELTLQGCRFADDALAVLCDLLVVNTSLTYLELSYCDLSDTDFLRIVDSLRLNSSLHVRSMYFGGNLFGNCSAKALAELLKENTTVSKIHLWGNSIGNEGALGFSNLLMLNYTIEFINLGNNPINQGTKAEIQKLSNGRIVFL
ncbi:hypothetical protein GEMRC1_009802 [Eukaryota sp. GEM-RC1]